MSENHPAPSIMATDEGELLQHGRVRPPTRLGSQGRVGKFEIIKPIGHGGMGHVFAATEPVTGATVALKILRSEFAEDPRVVQIFLREARHMYQLSHPSILKVLEVSGPEEGPFLVMPLAPGGSLSKRISDEGALAYADTLTIAIQVAEGLAHAHSKGLIHRDLKPANVLLDETGHALITDFGLVRSYLGDSMVDTNRTAPEGTPAYMSPSVAAGQAEDTRCDIYAFGAVMYEMLSGRPPYEGADASSVMQAVLTGPPESLTALNPKAPKGLSSIAEWCMARELRDRYASMDDVLADLQRVQAGKKPRGPHGSTITATRPRRLLLGVAIVALLLAAGYGLVRLAGCSGESPEAECAKAAKYLAAGHGARAERAYISILTESPDHTQALLGLAEVVKDHGDFRRAIAIYHQIMATTPNSDEAREGLVRAQLHLGHFVPARTELDRWLLTDPDNETAKQLLAELDGKEGEPGDAPPSPPEEDQPPLRPFGRPAHDEAHPRPSPHGRPQREGGPPGRDFGGGPRLRRRPPDAGDRDQ
jgi:tetratricopeptide (TPR) repeat protein